MRFAKSLRRRPDHPQMARFDGRQPEYSILTREPVSRGRFFSEAGEILVTFPPNEGAPISVSACVAGGRLTNVPNLVWLAVEAQTMPSLYQRKAGNAALTNLTCAR